METEFYQSFAEDLKKVKEKKLFGKVEKTIKEIEEAKDILEVRNIIKMKGTKNYYRIKIGDFRMGIVLREDKISFVRFLHRKDIYRYFP